MKKSLILKFSKVSLRDQSLWKSFGAQAAVFSTIVTLVSFCITLPDGWRWRVGCSLSFTAVLIGLFLLDWYSANTADSARLLINGTRVNVRIGDIFAQEGLKVIGVNNYIDLAADDVTIAKLTLHGQFALRHQAETEQIKEAVADSKTLRLEKTADGGRQSYDYGSCVLYKDYVLTVLTKFDLQNKAYTSIQEYVQFWMTFWENMDAIYNSRTIHIPILGAGQTRFRGSRPGKQELLEIALWTLKESGFANSYSDRSVDFIVYEKDAPEIDFYRIRNKF